MADPSDKSIEFPAGELREITLRIPGEHFFCDTIDIPASLKPDKYEDFIEFVLNEGNLSPYPADQLAWGFQANEQNRQIFIFGTPLAKLSKWVGRIFNILGVWPHHSFPWERVHKTNFVISVERLQVLFRQIQLFGCTYSRFIESEGEEEDTEGKLISLFDLEKYEISKYFGCSRCF